MSHIPESRGTIRGRELDRERRYSSGEGVFRYKNSASAAAAAASAFATLSTAFKYPTTESCKRTKGKCVCIVLTSGLTENVK